MVLKTKGKKEWMSFTGQNEGRQFDPLANLDAKLSKYLLHLNNIVWITAAMGPFFLGSFTVQEEQKLRERMIEQAFRAEIRPICTLDSCHL